MVGNLNPEEAKELDGRDATLSNRLEAAIGALKFGN
jgi:hypothetical protein